MQRVALTFIGKDRPGIIARVARAVFEAGGNVEDTTMTLLEGEFAMIMIASLPSRAKEKLKVTLGRLKKDWKIHFFWKTLLGKGVRGEKHPRGTQTYVVSVVGKDRTGIVYETSRILAEAGLNITDLNSKVLGKGKKSVFVMALEVDIPEQFRLERLEPYWKRLRSRFKVDVTIRPLERLSL